jgi:hypothetical protein
MDPSSSPRMCRRAAIRCRPPLCGSAPLSVRAPPLSVRAPPRPVGASSPCKFRGLARKRPPPAAPMRPPAGGPKRPFEGRGCARPRVPRGPLAGCGCACRHGPERAERRTGAAISLTIPAARAFDPAAGRGGANSDSSGGASEVSNWDSCQAGGPWPLVREARFADARHELVEGLVHGRYEVDPQGVLRQDMLREAPLLRGTGELPDVAPAAGSY